MFQLSIKSLQNKVHLCVNQSNDASKNSLQRKMLIERLDILKRGKIIIALRRYAMILASFLIQVWIKIFSSFNVTKCVSYIIYSRKFSPFID